MDFRNKRMTEKEFMRMRQEVLATWPAASNVDLDEAVAFHKSLPSHKNFALTLLEARKNRRTLIRSESGVPDLEEFTRYLLFLQNEGEIDLLGTMVDSMTRNQKYRDAELGLKKSLETGRWVINGFPMVAYRITDIRRIIESVDRPVMIRGISPDYRLIDEIGFAGGHTGTSGNPLNAFCQYSSSMPLETVITNFQYVYRLMGHYADRGVPLTASVAGGFAILCPFSVLIAGAIVDSLIAAEQGVVNISLAVNTQGNLVQDVAAMITARKMLELYLNANGYHDVQVTLNCTNWSGRFPEDIFAACSIIALGVIAAIASNSEIATVKTIEEAKSIPKKEANAASVRLAKTLITMSRGQVLKLNEKEVKEEAAILETETRLIVDKIIDMGNGDVVKGEIKAIESGAFDVPFSTSRFVPCRVKGIRDAQGMVRYFDHGNLPLSRELVAFHKEKVAERQGAAGNALDYQTIADDLSAISKGLLRGDA
ncbi:MAG TPA: methylaspartate mutase subunit E [Syntrophorhabdaceae bacterium]|nr:methylaspartate mutase subunit E [Syntrophorhabdaceae bacterium]